MKFDWEHATANEIVVLHDAIRDLLQPKGLSWKIVFAEALANIEVGTDYERNFRRGKIANQRAKLVAHWFEERFPETAAYVDELLTSSHASIDAKSPWEVFIAEHGEYSNVELQIVQLEERSLNRRSLEGSPTKIDREEINFVAPQYEVKLHARFTFRIDSPLKGHLFVLQWSRGAWWPVPLGENTCWTTIDEGLHWRPYDPDDDMGQLPHLLSEHTEIGLHRIVFIVSRDLHHTLRNADIQKRLEPEHLSQIAEACLSAPKDTWRLYRLNVLFKALDAS